MSQKEKFSSNKIKQGVYDGLLQYRDRVKREKRNAALILALSLIIGSLILDFLIKAYPSFNPPPSRDNRIEQTK